MSTKEVIKKNEFEYTKIIKSHSPLLRSWFCWEEKHLGNNYLILFFCKKEKNIYLWNEIYFPYGKFFLIQRSEIEKICRKFASSFESANWKTEISRSNKKKKIILKPLSESIDNDS